MSFSSPFSFLAPPQNAEANAESVLELRAEGCTEQGGASAGQHAQAASSQGTGILVL